MHTHPLGCPLLCMPGCCCSTLLPQHVAAADCPPSGLIFLAEFGHKLAGLRHV